MTFRCIPSLIINGPNFVKGQQFKNHIYVGDPNNVLKIFNDNDVHEVSIVDPFIRDLTKQQIALLGKAFSNCFLPISYGGGVKKLSDVRELNKVGAEKFIFEIENIKDNDLTQTVSTELGKQANILHVPFLNYNSGGLNIRSSRSLFRRSIFLDWSYIKDICVNFGEVIFTDVRKEGLRSGFDQNALTMISSEIIGQQPILYQGGVSCKTDLKKIRNYGFSGALVGAAYLYSSKNKSVNVGFFDDDV
jgi:imidazole glycerol-phosphate synthase subunit HisF